MSILIPLAFYLAVTLLVPILNGAPVDAVFLEHAAVVVAVVAAVGGVAWAIGRARRYFAWAATSTAMRQADSRRHTRT